MSTKTSFSFFGTALSSIVLGMGCQLRSTDNDANVKTVGGDHGHEDFFGPIPSDLTRHITCPNVENTSPIGEIDGKEYRYKNSSEVNYSSAGWESRVAADWNALSHLNLGDMEVVVIDIRRVAGKPYYLYLSNGKQHKIREPWSSSKFMAAAAAASHARKISGGMVGLDGTSGNYNLGDMVTAMHSYLPIGNVPGNSNAMAMYFLTHAGREYSTGLLRDNWLKMSDNSVFKGGYGVNPFPTGSDLWVGSNGKVVSLPEIDEPYESKDMSALAQAEFLKRITQHVTDPSTAGPFLQRADISTLLYGSQKRPNEIGGMLKGDTTYMAEALMGGMPLGRYVGGFGGPENEPARKHFDAATNKQWRIFQKSGLGSSSSRNMSEVIMASYACLPNFEGGREFLIVTSARAPGQNAVGTADKMTTKAFNKIIPLLVPEFAPDKKVIKKPAKT